MRFRKKLFSGLIILLGIVVLLEGCKGGDCQTPTGYTVEKDGTILLDREGTIPCELCEERGLEDKIVVLESKYCGACKVAVPLMKEAGEEAGVEILFLDLSVKEESQKMEGFKILPSYTPTMVAGCNVYIGVKEKEEYKEIIGDFLERQKKS